MTKRPDADPGITRAGKPLDDAVAGIRMKKETAFPNERKHFHHWLTVQTQISVSADLEMRGCQH